MRQSGEAHSFGDPDARNRISDSAQLRSGRALAGEVNRVELSVESRTSILSMSSLSTLLICIAVPAILRRVYTRSAAGKAVSELDSVVFPESVAVPVIRWSGLVLFSSAAFASWTYGRSLLAASIFGFFGLLFAFARGGSIVLNRDGISGASTWGRKSALVWSDVVSLEFNAGTSTTIVIGRNGAKICHSGFHLDQVRFEEEVKKRTGLPMKVIQPGTWKPKISYR